METAQMLTAPPTYSSVPERSHLQSVVRVFMRDHGAVIGGILFLFVVIVSLFAPIVAPFDPYLIKPELRLVSPGTGQYLLGGDELGRDILSRLIWGGRNSLIIAIVPILIACAVGGILGILAGYFRGVWDDIIMRILEVFLAFPSILLALAIAAAIGPGITNIIIALSMVSIPRFARIIRSSVLSTREEEYVTAAITVGVTTRRIISRHIFPNILSPIIVLVSLEAGRMIILGAGLSFLGLGVLPPAPDWGSMLSNGQFLLPVAPHIATIPGLVIVFVTICLNLVGDGLREAFDPRRRN